MGLVAVAALFSAGAWWGMQVHEKTASAKDEAANTATSRRSVTAPPAPAGGGLVPRTLRQSDESVDARVRCRAPRRGGGRQTGGAAENHGSAALVFVHGKHGGHRHGRPSALRSASADVAGADLLRSARYGSVARSGRKDDGRWRRFAESCANRAARRRRDANRARHQRRIELLRQHGVEPLSPGGGAARQREDSGGEPGFRESYDGKPDLGAGEPGRGESGSSSGVRGTDRPNDLSRRERGNSASCSTPGTAAGTWERWDGRDCWKKIWCST